MATKDDRIKNVQIVTEKGVSVYPRLGTPDTKFNPLGVYSIRVRFAAEVAQPLIDKITALAEAKYVQYKAELEAAIEGDDKKAKIAAKKALEGLKYADKAYRAALDDDGEETGEIEFNFKMKAQRAEWKAGKKTGKMITQQPKVIDSKGTAIDADSVWSGSVVKVGGFLSPFATAVGVGVSLQLAQVAVYELVSGSGAGNNKFDFGNEEGYEAPAEDEAVAPTDAADGSDGSGPDEF